MISTKDATILSWLRKSGRIKLTTLSARVAQPVSTIFEKLKSKYRNYIPRHTCLLNYAELGYKVSAFVLFKLRGDKQACIHHLTKHYHVNTVVRVNNGWDVLCEFVAKDMCHMEQLLDEINQEFKISKQNVHYVLEYVCREQFFSDPPLVTIFHEKFK